MKLVENVENLQYIFVKSYGKVEVCCEQSVAREAITTNYCLTINTQNYTKTDKKHEN